MIVVVSCRCEADISVDIRPPAVAGKAVEVRHPCARCGREAVFSSKVVEEPGGMFHEVRVTG